MAEHTHTEHIEEDLPRIVLFDGDGNSLEFYVVDYVSIDSLEHEYVLLYPVEIHSDDDDGYLIVRARPGVVGEDGCEQEGGVWLEFIEDEEEFNRVVAILEELASGTGRYELVTPDDGRDLTPHDPAG